MKRAAGVWLPWWLPLSPCVTGHPFSQWPQWCREVALRGCTDGCCGAGFWCAGVVGSRGRTDLPVPGSSTFPNTFSAACEAAPAELGPGDAVLGLGSVSVAAPTLQLPSDFGSCLSGGMPCRDGPLGSLTPAPCGSGDCIT